jgi:flagellar export protein FliJ
MSQPKYRLQLILDKRQKEKEDAEKKLALAQKALEEERKIEKQKELEVEQAKQRKEDSKKELNQKMLEGLLDISKIRQGKDFLKSLDIEIEKAKERLVQQQQKVQQAEKFLEQRRSELIEATTQFQAMEKHKENWLAKIKKEQEAAEQNEQEEIGNVLFLQRKSQQQ